jgi:hypothetical protein
MSPVGQRKLSPPGFRALPARFGEVLAGRVWTVNYQLLRDAIGQLFHRLVFVVNLSRSITGRAFSSDLVSAHDSTVSPYWPSPILHGHPPRRLSQLPRWPCVPDPAASLRRRRRSLRHIESSGAVLNRRERSLSAPGRRTRSETDQVIMTGSAKPSR